MKKGLKSLIFYLVLFSVIVSVVSVMYSGPETEALIYSDLVKELQINNVKELSVSGTTAIAIRNDDTRFETNIPSMEIFHADVGSVIKKQVEAGTLQYSTPPIAEAPWWVSMIPGLIMVILFIVFWMFLMSDKGSGGGRGAMSFGKSRAKMADEKNGKKVTFGDVAGEDEEKEELQEVVEFLKNPDKFEKMGARIPKGVLLVGPPGTGKTLLAKAVSGEAGVPFFSISGSDFVEMFVGVGASRVRDLFEQAKKNAPCIIFIDEIDAVGRKRGAGLGGGHDEREQTLNQLLVEMDGFGVYEGIIIIAATNRPDILDPALLRPGRFDRQVVVGYPDAKGRTDIMHVHAKNKPLASDVDLEVIAKTTAGFTGAELENLMNEAALLAVKRDKEAITMEELNEAMIKVVVGQEKKSRKISDKEKKLTAYHEAGHAIATRALPNQDPVHQVSIIPRGRAGGYTMHLPTEDKMYMAKSDMLDEIVVLLAGRIAEKLIMNDISTGASNDIQRATQIARGMVTKYGMSDNLGTVFYDSEQEEVFIGRDFGHAKNYSEEVAAEIDREIRRIIDEGYERCEAILKENMAKLHVVAQALIEKEKIGGAEFEELYNSI